MALNLTAPDFDTADTVKKVVRDLDKRPKAEQDKLKKDHATALARFHASASFFTEQRKREVEDLKFVDFDDQWDPAVRASRSGGAGTQASANSVGLPPTPPRPTLTINQLRGPCQQVASQRRQARLALEFSAKGNGASAEIAEVFEDIARGIQAESRAAIARNWAADRAEKCGTGWYRIDTQYCLETPTDDAAWNDQEIVYRRILNQGSVFPDPNAQEPDFSDGKSLFITQDIPVEDYKRDYPDSQLTDYDDAQLTAIGAHAPKWVFTADTGDGMEGKIIRIAEHWQVVETSRTRVELEDGRSAYDDEVPDGARILKFGKTRKVSGRKILWSKINAVEYLEEPQEWNGSYIPIPPVIGEESNVDGERRWTGIVRPGKDAAVSYNVMRSAQVETIGLATKAPYIGYFETIEPYLDWWKQSNIRNFFMLPIKFVRDAAGAPLPPPKRNVEEPAIQAITLAAHEAKDDVHSTTGIPPVALGQLDPHERSGKAIQALQQQSETGSSGYLDNLANISIQYEGKILRDLIPRIYDRPKRIVPAVGIDEKRRMVMLNFPYTEGKDGAPIAFPGDWQKGQPVPEGHKLIDLSAGEYSVAVSVGKSYPTRKAEASAAISNVLQVVPPEMAAAIAPAWLEEQDYPGAKKIAEIAKKSLPPQLQQAYQDDQQQSAIPPEVQAQIQQLQQQLQQAQQMLETDAAKQQAMLQKAQADNQTKMQLGQADQQFQVWKARLDAQTKIAVAEISAATADADRQVEIADTLIGVEKEQRLEKDSRTHEHVQNALDRQHEKEMAAQEHAHALEQAAAGVQGDAALADQGQQHALEQGQQAHGQTLEAQQQAAYLAPEPATTE